MPFKKKSSSVTQSSSQSLHPALHLPTTKFATHSKMHFTQALTPLAFATAAFGQTLNIPARNGAIQVLEGPRTLSGANNDFNNQEFELNRPCDTDDDLGSEGAVFILNDGATLSNVIIGVNQLEGVHCKGKCTLKNVWFRDVCEGKLDIHLPLSFLD